MEKTLRRRSLPEEAARLLDLPADAVAGVPRIELTGDCRLRVEGHRGILAYDPAEIHIGGGRMGVLVRGAGLELKAMDRRALLIAGQITAIELE